MTLGQILPAIALGSLSLASLPTSLDAAVDAALGVPAIAEALPDDVEAWLKGIEIGPAERESAPDGGEVMTRDGRTAKSDGTSTRSRAQSEPQPTTVKGEAPTSAATRNQASRDEPVRAKPAATPAAGPVTEPAAEPATKPSAKPTRPIAKPSTEAASGATADEPFGHWVREQTHSGLEGRALAEAIHAEKARRK